MKCASISLRGRYDLPSKDPHTKCYLQPISDNSIKIAKTTVNNRYICVYKVKVIIVSQYSDIVTLISSIFCFRSCEK